MYLSRVGKKLLCIGTLSIGVALPVLVAPSLIGSSVACAQTATNASRTKKAKALVDEGIELRRNGDDEAALVALQQAELLEDPSPRLLVHLAATHQALGHWEAADQYLTQALASPENVYIRRHKATLGEARRRIDRQIGTLDVRGEPAGAQVLVNGREVGTLPLRAPLRITAGVYTLEVRHPGFYSTTRSLALAGGSITRESLSLARAPKTTNPNAFASGPVGSEADLSRPDWLGWSLAALGAGSAAATLTAWQIREDHAEQWNDNSQCLAAGQTRRDVCASELENGESAETLMWVGLVATSAFTAGAIYRLVWDSPATLSATASAMSCGVGPLSLGCTGTF